MLTESELQNLRDAFDDSTRLHGLLLHGSCAKGVDDPASDIDLICIQRVGPAAKKEATFAGRSVELYMCPARLIRRSFTKVEGSNNNVLLNAFVCGRILSDHSGLVSRLASEAQEVWRKGPPAITRGQYTRRIYALVHGLERCHRALERNSSELSAELARLLADRVFREAVAMYCRINRRWASSLAETLQWFQRDDPEFHELCRQYLLCANLRQRVAKLEPIVHTMVKTNGRSLLTQ
jgi:hypothetical protein